MKTKVIAKVEMPNKESNILICGTLVDPEEKCFYEIPTTISLTVKLDNKEETILAELVILDMSARHYGNKAVLIMDSYDEDLSVIAIELFETRKDKYLPGNLIILNCYGGQEPSDELFSDDFDITGFIYGVAAVCNKLMRNKSRAADYFVFYGNESLWPPDSKWKKKLSKVDCDVYDLPHWGTFIAVKRLPTNHIPSYIKITEEKTK